MLNLLFLLSIILLPVTNGLYSGYGMSGAAFPWDPAQDMKKCLTQTVDEVFGPDRPIGLELVVHEGNSAQVLLDCSQDALMLVVGRFCQTCQEITT